MVEVDPSRWCMGRDSDPDRRRSRRWRPTPGGRPRGRHEALAAPPARPESRERSPEAQGPGKRAKVLHQTKGGASSLPQMPWDGHWHSQRPLPPPQRPAPGGGKGPHARVSACSTPSREPAAWAARQEGSGAVLASRGTRREQLYLAAPARKHAVANNTQSLHLAAPGRFIPLRLPLSAGSQSRKAPEPTDMTGEGSPGTREVSRFDHQDAR